MEGEILHLLLWLCVLSGKQLVLVCNQTLLGGDDQAMWFILLPVPRNIYSTQVWLLGPQFHI